jgi:diguanylate cyclase (GGDEF)-like protein
MIDWPRVGTTTVIVALGSRCAHRTPLHEFCGKRVAQQRRSAVSRAQPQWAYVIDITARGDQRVSDGLHNLPRKTQGARFPVRDRSATLSTSGVRPNASLTERDKPPSTDGEAPAEADGEAPAEADGKTSERRRNRDHAAVERERAAAEREAAAAERDQSQAEADQRTETRDRAASDRELAAADRDEDASRRDQSQAETDQGVENRIQAGVDRQQSASDREQSASDRGQSEADAHERTSNRIQSTSDREHAAADRRRAVTDRVAADRDDQQTSAALRVAQLDQLTGTVGRGVGMLLLEREINRARRGNGELVLAYIDVDRLKQVNDRHGHAAGDALLRDVARAIQLHLRAYDTLVRVGGDEFICALGDCTLAIAHARFRAIRGTMAETHPTASISVGFAELRPEDTLEQLTERGDLAVYEAKRSR